MSNWNLYVINTILLTKIQLDTTWNNHNNNHTYYYRKTTSNATISDEKRLTSDE